VALSACTGGSAMPTAAPATQRRAVTTSSAPASSPVLVTTSSNRRDVPGASDRPSLKAPQLRVPSDGQQVVMVDSTDGEGVWVRRQPAGEPLRVWPDGTPMLVVGEDQVADDRTWRNVTTLDGQSGWVAADFVKTVDRATIAASMPELEALLNGTDRGAAAATRDLQARLAVGEATPSATPAATQQVGQPTASSATTAKVAPKPRGAFVGRSLVPPTATTGATAGATTTAAATVAATATPQPTSTSAPTATPIKAATGASSIDVGETTMAVAGAERGVNTRIGNRPRSGMELLAIKVTVSNHGDAPFALYRGAFRLALSDRTRVEPLAGGTSPLPYSAEVAPDDDLEGTLTFEVPTGTRVDSLIWAPDRDASYSLALPN
jgi:hypothetical protein